MTTSYKALRVLLKALFSSLFFYLLAYSIIHLFNNKTMSIKTFWTILLKTFGLWLIFSGIMLLPQSLTSLFQLGLGRDLFMVGLIALVLLLTFGIYALILWLFVFKTDWLIDKLHLEKGFTEDRIDLNIRFSTILTISFIIMGGIMLIDSLPDLVQQLILLFRQNASFKDNSHTGDVIFLLVKAILGYLLMTNSKTVVSFVCKQVNNNHK